MAFTEAAEFARGITVEAAKEPASARESDSHMGIGDDVTQPEPLPKKVPKLEPAAAGGWVAAGADADEDADVDMADAGEDDDDAAAAPGDSVTRERAIGTGGSLCDIFWVRGFSVKRLSPFGLSGLAPHSPGSFAITHRWI